MLWMRSHSEERSFQHCGQGFWICFHSLHGELLPQLCRIRQLCAGVPHRHLWIRIVWSSSLEEQLHHTTSAKKWLVCEFTEQLQHSRIYLAFRKRQAAGDFATNLLHCNPTPQISEQLRRYPSQATLSWRSLAAAFELDLYRSWGKLYWQDQHCLKLAWLPYISWQTTQKGLQCWQELQSQRRLSCPVEQTAAHNWSAQSATGTSCTSQSLMDLLCH